MCISGRYGRPFGDRLELLCTDGISRAYGTEIPKHNGRLVCHLTHSLLSTSTFVLTYVGLVSSPNAFPSCTLRANCRLKRGISQGRKQPLPSQISISISIYDFTRHSTWDMLVVELFKYIHAYHCASDKRTVLD